MSPSGRIMYATEVAQVCRQWFVAGLLLGILVGAGACALGVLLA